MSISDTIEECTVSFIELLLPRTIVSQSSKAKVDNVEEQKLG